MKGDRVEAVVDTGQGTRTFEITASRAGRRLEVTSARGIVEVTEVTRHGTPVRTGRFMASRLIALVEHPALEADGGGVEVSTRRRLGRPAPGGQLTLGSHAVAARPRRGDGRAAPAAAAPDIAVVEVAPDASAADEAEEPDSADLRPELERADAEVEPDPADGAEPVET